MLEVYSVFPHNVFKNIVRGSWKVGIVQQRINPFPTDKILDFSKLKEFANDNFKFDENSRKFSKRKKKKKKKKKKVRKGEIACY